MNNPLSKTSGAARRRARVARGLPRLSEYDLAYEAVNKPFRTRRRDQARYASRRAFTDRIKIERGCADCGFNAHPAALDFDHLPGSDKAANVSQMRTRMRMETIRAEIAKCEVVCANCHRIRTAERRTK